MDEELYNTIDDTTNKMHNAQEEDVWCYFRDTSGCDDVLNDEVNVPRLPPRPMDQQYIDLALVPIGSREGAQLPNENLHTNETNESILNAITGKDIESALSRPSFISPENPLMTIHPISDGSVGDRSTDRLSVFHEINPIVETIVEAVQIETETKVKFINTYSVPVPGEDDNDEHKYFPFQHGQELNADFAKNVSGTLDDEGYLIPLQPLKTKILSRDPSKYNTTHTMHCQNNERENDLAEPNMDPVSTILQPQHAGLMERTEGEDYLIPIHPEYVDTSLPASIIEGNTELDRKSFSTNDKNDNDNGGVENSDIPSIPPAKCNPPLCFGYLDLDGSQVQKDDIADQRRSASNELIRHTEDDNDYITPIDTDMDCLPLAQGYHEWDGSQTESVNIQKSQ